ncbi:hypothetical protein AB0D08_22455 [Kitasatospora sp. NPDC048540]|uniref:hypothetical protein n=1 Tax=unclassified Kitasatospora TaxID=2633591 RepID=UPI0005396060|nr:hypothetical protein [Kitasatospora sp. MBT63]
MGKTVYVVSHGRLYNPRASFETPVTLHFNSLSGAVVYRGNGIAVLNVGGFKAIGASETIGPGGTVSNYHLSAFNDWELIQHLAVEGNSQLDGKLYVIGELQGKTVKNSRGEEIGVESIAECHLDAAVRTMIEKEGELDSIQLISCRIGLGGGGGGTIPLGNEESLPTDSSKRLRFGRGGGDEFNFDDEEDQRRLPTSRREYQKRRRISRTPEGMRGLENLPQSIRASFYEFGDDDVHEQRQHWENVQRESNWTTPDRRHIVPMIVWDAEFMTPSTINDAWPEKDWRDAFYLFLEGYYGSLPSRTLKHFDLKPPGELKANLNLWLMISQWLSPGENLVAFVDGSGKELSAEQVMDSEIIAYAKGDRGPQPRTPAGSVEGIEFLSGRLMKISLAANASGQGEFFQIYTSIDDADAKFVAQRIHSWMQGSSNREVKNWADSNPPGDALPEWIGTSFFMLPDELETEYWQIVDSASDEAVRYSRELLEESMTQLRDALCENLQAWWEAFASVRDALALEETKEKARRNATEH